MDIVVQWLAGGVLDRGNANSLTVKLDAARRQLERDGGTPAVQQLEAVLNELDALVRSGRLEAAEAAALRELVQRVIAAVQ
jgi:hypothetical protein